jgi:hypothetical protein
MFYEIKKSISMFMYTCVTLHHLQFILFEFQKKQFQFIFQIFFWECRELASHVRQRVIRFCILSPSMFFFLIRVSGTNARNISIVGNMSKPWVILLRTYCQFCWILKISVFQVSVQICCNSPTLQFSCSVSVQSSCSSPRIQFRCPVPVHISYSSLRVQFVCPVSVHISYSSTTMQLFCSLSVQISYNHPDYNSGNHHKTRSRVNHPVCNSGDHHQSRSYESPRV